MANVMLTRSSNVQNVQQIDGQLIFDTSGNGNIYLDNGTDRLKMGGTTITVDQKLNKTSTNPIANKGVAGVMLSSLDDISAVTQAGYLPDALAVKSINTSLFQKTDAISGDDYQKVTGIGYDETNKKLMIKVGASTEPIPFSGGLSELPFSFYLPTRGNEATITLPTKGFKSLSITPWATTTGSYLNVLKEDGTSKRLWTSSVTDQGTYTYDIDGYDGGMTIHLVYSANTYYGKFSGKLSK